MEMRPRRKFSDEFKAKIAIEAKKERSSIEEIARRNELHPNQISLWKKEFLAKAALVFTSDDKNSTDKNQQEALLNKLYGQIGQQRPLKICFNEFP
jgi:transposase